MVDSKTHHGPSSCGDDDASASSCEAEPQPEKQAASAPWSVVDALLGVALAGAIVGLVLAAYAPMLDAYLGWGLAGEWDDRSNFLENELVRKPLSRELLGKMFTAERVNVFEPLGWLLKALVQRATADLEEASGLLTVNAWCHRMATLGLHAACGVALFAALPAPWSDLGQPYEALGLAGAHAAGELCILAVETYYRGPSKRRKLA